MSWNTHSRARADRHREVMRTVAVSWQCGCTTKFSSASKERRAAEKARGQRERCDMHQRQDREQQRRDIGTEGIDEGEDLLALFPQLGGVA